MNIIVLNASTVAVLCLLRPYIHLILWTICKRNVVVTVASHKAVHKEPFK